MMVFENFRFCQNLRLRQPFESGSPIKTLSIRYLLAMRSSGKSDSGLADGTHQEAKDKMNVLRTKNVKKYHLEPKVLLFQKS